MAKKKTSKSSKVKQPTEKQLQARAKFALMAKNKSKKGKYKVDIWIGADNFTCYTDDISQAILDLKPKKITNKVRILIEEGPKKAERIMFVFPARRLFNIPMAAEFFEKNIIQRLK